MGNPYFKFKQFTVFHDLCAMKVGIDGVLLGAWSDVSEADSILDIGTGSGLISLMLAQRNSTAKIDAIDIDTAAIEQATLNFNNSVWKDRLLPRLISLQAFTLENNKKYDLITSNPPYFQNSLKTPDTQRNTARHTDTLPHHELIQCSKKMLSPNGRLTLILPVNEAAACIEYAEFTGLYCRRLVTVFPTPTRPVKRLLIEFRTEKGERETYDLTIETETRHQYTPEFTSLAKDFYLKL